MKRAVRFAAIAAAVIFMAAACTDNDNTTPAPTQTSSVGATVTPANQPADGVGIDFATPTDGGDSASQITIVGKNIAFDRKELTIATSVETTIVFDNQDDGVPHNIRVQGGSAGDFKTEIESGPTTQTLTFTIDEPGTYTFLCDVHPAQMTGTLIVR